MGWIDYYRLLEKYDGDLDAARIDELREAAQANPNTPGAARLVAQSKWASKKMRERFIGEEAEPVVTDILVAIDDVLRDHGEAGLTDALPDEAAGPLIDDLRTVIKHEIVRLKVGS